MTLKRIVIKLRMKIMNKLKKLRMKIMNRLKKLKWYMSIQVEKMFMRAPKLKNIKNKLPDRKSEKSTRNL